MGLWVAGPRNVELYDVSSTFAIADLHYACLTVCDYCTEGCICDVIGLKNTPRIATKMSRGLFKCKALHV